MAATQTVAAVRSETQRSRASGTYSSADSSLSSTTSSNEAQWGSNFWVTLVDPETGTAFYACPSTGQMTWDPPKETFIIPPSPEGEWWEIVDESSGTPYYYHTKSGDTVWDRPTTGFIIPLSMLQNSVIGKRLSMSLFGSMPMSPTAAAPAPRPAHGRTGSASSQRTATSTSPTPASRSSDARHNRRSLSARGGSGAPLTPIPGSPEMTDVDADSIAVPPRSAPPTVSSTRRKSTLPPQDARVSAQPLVQIGDVPRKAEKQASRTSLSSLRQKSKSKEKEKEKEKEKSRRDKSRERASFMPDELGRLPTSTSTPAGSSGRSRPRSQSYLPRMGTAQSLTAAAELVVSATSPRKSISARVSQLAIPPMPTGPVSMPSTPIRARTQPDAFMAPGPDAGMERDDRAGLKSKLKESDMMNVPASPRRPIPALPGGSWAKRNGSSAALNISRPVLDLEATANMTPLKTAAMGRPIHIDQDIGGKAGDRGNRSSLRVLPDQLVTDIQQFIESEYAQQYFATHKTGFLFKRRVPMQQMMTWQKTPLSSPLLNLSNRALHKDAVKAFKVLQRVMADRSGPPARGAAQVATNGSDESGPSVGLLEEERWLLGEGLAHGELRDEIYCQLMKQLSGNPNPESVFKGWQFLCVLLITFPPSKNFETYLRGFIQQRTTHTEGRVDVMAKYCLRRLAVISKKGPRGKAPSLSEIETASDAAFNPSTFGESLDAIIRLQERAYPNDKVPIILPFLADGILALGGAKSEGIFRVPGDGDAVADLKLRIDRGHYHLSGIDDPHVPASALKLWLRELLDPPVPDELYNACIECAREPEDCISMVARLPTINRRVVLFVISFLQLFLEPKIQKTTKMTPVNLALVMAPNLLRCNSDSMAVVFTNSQYEQTFVYNLLLHLRCDEVDPDYRPSHGLGAKPRPSMSRPR